MNIVDLKTFKEKKTSREQLRETLSNPMKSLVKKMFKQSIRDATDKVLLEVVDNFRDENFNLNEDDIKELASYTAEEFRDLAEALEYINNMEEF